MITSAAGSASFWQQQRDPHDDEQQQYASKILKYEKNYLIFRFHWFYIR